MKRMKSRGVRVAVSNFATEKSRSNPFMHVFSVCLFITEDSHESDPVAHSERHSSSSASIPAEGSSSRSSRTIPTNVAAAIAMSVDLGTEHDERWSQITSSQRFRAMEPDVQWYLNYHKSHINHHHYHMSHGSSDFSTYYIIEQSLTSDSLLFSIVAFTAYHFAVSNPEGKATDFLGYYGKALEKLRDAIANRRRMRTQTLLTVLQLASLEVQVQSSRFVSPLTDLKEHFGDWVTLLHHQKGGYQILTEIYTLDMVITDPIVNKILEWYMRFDLHAGFLAGRRNVLKLEWFEAHHKGYSRQLQDASVGPMTTCDEKLALNRLLATRVTAVFAKYSNGELNEQQFERELEALQRQFKAWTDDVHPDRIAPGVAQITTFGDFDAMTEATNTYLAQGNTIGPIQYALVSFWSLELMMKFQKAKAQGRQLGPDALVLATKIGALIGAIVHGDTTPGALLNIHAPLGMMGMFLLDPQTNYWCRKLLVQVECLG